MALHTDTDSPHVHLTINNLGFDGKRLHVRKGLPQLWREQFACELDRLGVAAEATTSGSFQAENFLKRAIATNGETIETVTP